MMGIVVIVHEYGHYWMGRRFGAAVESFSVGFGRSIWERTDRKGTRWRINWIPLGGFVKFVGEAQLANDIGVVKTGPQGKAYPELGVGARSLVSLAGPIANFILASLIFALGLWVHGVQPQSVTIQGVNEGSPAEQAGFQSGDVFQSTNGKTLKRSTDVQTAIALSPNVPITFEMDRGGEIISITVTPDEVIRENMVGQKVAQSTIGVGLVTAAYGDRVHYNPIQALGGGIIETGRTLDQTVTMLGRIITGNMSVHTMSGPVGIGDISRRVVNRVMEQEQTTMGQKINQLFWIQLGICAAISVGIGFFNLLPLPVLDGGHLVFNAYEAVTGKTMPEKVQEASLTFGLILLLGMVVVITWGDIIETGVFGASGG
jgi:regulator of sigma E protease